MKKSLSTAMLCIACACIAFSGSACTFLASPFNTTLSWVADLTCENRDGGVTSVECSFDVALPACVDRSCISRRGEFPRALTWCHLSTTINYIMRVLMDADCLIKITCAGLKEPTLACFETTCPGAVRDDVVRDGAGRSESQLVQANLEAGRLAVFEGTLEQGDDALVEAFNSGDFDVVATDDRRLIRRLDPLGIPCVVPGLLLHELAMRGQLSDLEVAAGLERLRPLIGAEEYQMTRFLLQGAR